MAHPQDRHSKRKKQKETYSNHKKQKNLWLIPPKSLSRITAAYFMTPPNRSLISLSKYLVRSQLLPRRLHLENQPRRVSSPVTSTSSVAAWDFCFTNHGRELCPRHPSKPSRRADPVFKMGPALKRASYPSPKPPSRPSFAKVLTP